MAGERIRLQWHRHGTGVTSAFDSLRRDGELTDVTLCCEGKRVAAHKMMLSACSPYFRDLLKNNPCQQMAIFLQNTSSANLTALVEFMYRGCVNVAQSQLASFIMTAKMLQIKGLSEEEQAGPPPPSPRRTTPAATPSAKRRRLSVSNSGRRSEGSSGPGSKPAPKATAAPKAAAALGGRARVTASPATIPGVGDVLIESPPTEEGETSQQHQQQQDQQQQQQQEPQQHQEEPQQQQQKPSQESQKQDEDQEKLERIYVNVKLESGGAETSHEATLCREDDNEDSCEVSSDRGQDDNDQEDAGLEETGGLGQTVQERCDQRLGLRPSGVARRQRTYTRRRRVAPLAYGPPMTFHASEGRRAGSLIYRAEDGYSYVVKRRTGDGVYLRCQYFKSQGCLGAGCVRGDELRVNRTHSHGVKALDQEIAGILVELRRIASNEFETRSNREIFDSVVFGAAREELNCRSVFQMMNRERNRKSRAELDDLVAEVVEGREVGRMVGHTVL